MKNGDRGWPLCVPWFDENFSVNKWLPFVSKGVEILVLLKAEILNILHKADEALSLTKPRSGSLLRKRQTSRRCLSLLRNAKVLKPIFPRRLRKHATLLHLDLVFWSYNCYKTLKFSFEINWPLVVVLCNVFQGIFQLPVRSGLSSSAAKAITSRALKITTRFSTL